VEEIAVTQAFSDRSARKKSDGERVIREVHTPMPSMAITYRMNTTAMVPVMMVSIYEECDKIRLL
jgi:hypothetical protein